MQRSTRHARPAPRQVPRQALLAVALALAITLALAPAARADDTATPPAHPEPSLIDRAAAELLELARDLNLGIAAVARDMHDHVRTTALHWRGRAQRTADAVLATLQGELRETLQRHVDRTLALGARPTGSFILAPHDPTAPPEAAGDWPRWDALGHAEHVPERLVLLVHGMDEGGGVWATLAPALARAGHHVARFEYPNDQPVADSADLLAQWLVVLRRAGVREVDVVAHSMGGLIARDVLTRTAHYAGDARGSALLPAVPRLVMVGTPNAGSPWARLQPVGEAIEAIARTCQTRDASHLLGFMHDGDGQAGADLLPGSPFLRALNARPRPAHITITAISGAYNPARHVDWRAVQSRLAQAAGPGRAQRWTARARTLTRHAAAWIGDGVVSIDSAAYPAADRLAVVRAGHRGMVADTGPDRWLARLGLQLEHAPAVPIILEALADRPPTP